MRAAGRPNTSSTALRVLHVLECVGRSPEPVSVTEIADIAKIDRAQAYRALRTLLEAGFVERDDVSQTYILSFKILTLSQIKVDASRSPEAIRATLRRIVAETDETCSYAVLDGQKSLLVQREEGGQTLVVNFKVGARATLHSHSIGKAMLAHQDQAFIDRICDAPMESYTEHTITEPDALRLELQRVRDAGMAIDDHEVIIGMRCVAVPIIEPDGRVRSGLSMSGPALRYTDEKLHELGRVMSRHASELGPLVAR